jgi:hypothetical protein
MRDARALTKTKSSVTGARLGSSERRSGREQGRVGSEFGGVCERWEKARRGRSEFEFEGRGVEIRTDRDIEWIRRKGKGKLGREERR